MSVTVEKCLQAWTNSLRQMNVKADIVFFGDSLTYYGDFASAFPDKVVCNLGLRGDTIQGMIDRVEQVKMLEPKHVFLMAGINDVTTNSIKEFEKRYNQLVKTILENNLDIELIIQSILPVNDNGFSINCNNEQIKKCNLVISKLADDYRLQYIDLFSRYLNSVMHQSVTKDGIHLLPAAYSEWYNELNVIELKW